MSFYRNPAMDYFMDRAISLPDGAHFSYTYEFEDKGINLSVYDDVASEYRTLQFLPSFPEARALVTQLASEYSRINPDEFLGQWELFFNAMENTVWMSVKLIESEDGEDDYTFCDTCGSVNTNEVSFLLIPAVPDAELMEETLCVHHEFGCYGGRSIEGPRSEVEADARAILANAAEVADWQPRESVQAMLDVLDSRKVTR